MYSLVHMNIFNKHDIIVQIAASTFDVHVQEILGTLLYCATIVMLHPHGHRDFMYLIQTLHTKQVTYMLAVPSFLNHLYDFIDKENISRLVTMQTICCVGE